MAVGPRLIVSDLAEADLIKVIEFLDEQWSPELAIRFVDSYYQKLDLIESMPSVGFLSEKVPDVRKVKIDKFNVICYEVNNQVITVLRIIDTRSSPDTNPY
ncbi:type II toxin-antitoxin system RelE/ParE family toxin [Spirosoma spitsbergense]|uniref:type II toxin-antitoxin system RelE/ParE family toxin n=1 Tax=Spirosoma spitsbergense TaxID=431554 RepID=UPI0003800DC9|nr:type II toxin-antitoxin system RelE/ParE family toxin [Spirosoma spitsbergense]